MTQIYMREIKNFITFNVHKPNVKNCMHLFTFVLLQYQKKFAYKT